jgi:hypothetical protein
MILLSVAAHDKPTIDGLAGTYKNHGRWTKRIKPWKTLAPLLLGIDLDGPIQTDVCVNLHPETEGVYTFHIMSPSTSLSQIMIRSNAHFSH